MKKIFLMFLFLVFLTTSAMSASVDLHWDKNDPVPSGYRIFQRTAETTYSYDVPAWDGLGIEYDEGMMTTIDDLDATRTYYFVIRAYNSCGNESADSEELVVDMPKIICSQTPDPNIVHGCYVGTVTE